METLTFSQAMYLGAKYDLAFSKVGDGLEIDANNTEFIWRLSTDERAQLVEFLSTP